MEDFEKDGLIEKRRIQYTSRKTETPLLEIFV